MNCLPDSAGTSTHSAPAATLPVVSWQNMRVITTELLAKQYEVDDKQIHDNFQNNQSRFVAGKHYFRLEGESLKKLKNYPESVGVVSKHARQIILWTERGAARHAKMLDTDAAWEVFEQLEDFYFRAAEPAESPAERVRLRHEAIGIHKAMNSMLVMRRERDGKGCAFYHFMNEAKLINHVLIGKFEGMDRDSLSLEQLGLLAKLEMQNAMLIAEGLAYADRKAKLEEFAQSIALNSPQVVIAGGSKQPPGE